MPFMNLRAVPDEALLEDVETLPVEPEEVTEPMDVAAVKQYTEDPSTPYRKVITKLAPLYDSIEHVLREIPLEPEDQVSAAKDLMDIQNAAKCIAECMPMLITKLNACSMIFMNDKYAYQSLYANAKIFITKRDKIKRSGLAKYRAIRNNTFPVLSDYNSCNTCMKLFHICMPGDDYILNMQALKSVSGNYGNSADLDYFESMSDMINVASHPESERFTRLSSIDERTYDLLDIFAESVECSGRSSEHATNCRNEINDTVACHCAKMLKYVSTNVYDLMIMTDDNDTDNKYYRETLKKVIAAVCNEFYMCAMMALSLAFRIEQAVNDKRDLDAHMSKIIAEIK